MQDRQLTLEEMAGCELILDTTRLAGLTTDAFRLIGRGVHPTFCQPVIIIEAVNAPGFTTGRRYMLMPQQLTSAF